MSKPDDFTRAVLAYHGAAWPVLNDPAVWLEEQQSAERRLMAWPFPPEGTQFRRLLAVLQDADIRVMLVLLQADEDPRSPAWPPDPRDPKMQVLLRVSHRSMLAGEAALTKEFGGGRLTGMREFKNRVAEQMDQYARSLVRPGLPLDRVLELLDLPRSSTFRANARRHQRRKSHYLPD